MWTHVISVFVWNVSVCESIPFPQALVCKFGHLCLPLLCQLCAFEPLWMCVSAHENAHVCVGVCVWCSVLCAFVCSDCVSLLLAKTQLLSVPVHCVQHCVQWPRAFGHSWEQCRIDNSQTMAGILCGAMGSGTYLVVKALGVWVHMTIPSSHTMSLNHNYHAVFYCYDAHQVNVCVGANTVGWVSCCVPSLHVQWPRRPAEANRQPDILCRKSISHSFAGVPFILLSICAISGFGSYPNQSWTDTDLNHSSLPTVSFYLYVSLTVGVCSQLPASISHLVRAWLGGDCWLWGQDFLFSSVPKQPWCSAGI